MRQWTVDETFQIIREYETNKPLWLTTHPEYKVLQVRATIMKEIAKKFENCNASDVKEKLRSLRNVFMEKLREVKKNNDEHKKETKWRYFKSLQFLQHVDARPRLVGAAAASHKKANLTMKTSQIATRTVAVKPEATETMQTKLPIADSNATTNNVTTSTKEPRKKKLKLKSENTVRGQEDIPTDTVRVPEESRHDFECSIMDFTQPKVMDFNEFANFVTTSLQQLDDLSLQEIAQLKIRMILAQLSQEACKRKLIHLEHANRIETLIVNDDEFNVEAAKTEIEEYMLGVQ